MVGRLLRVLIMETVERLNNYLSIYGRTYPNAWRQLDEFRDRRGSSNAFEWNDWCFVPLAGAYAVISGGGLMPPSKAADVGILGALGAWRVTQGIYRFDETIFSEVWESEISSDIPVEVLYYLPEWCCYIETPRKTFGGDNLFGFFVSLDDDRQNLRDELRLVLDTANGLIAYPLHLGKTTIAESLESVAREAQYQAQKAGLDFMQHSSIKSQLAKEIEPILSLILYLCSQTGEIPDFENRPQPNYHPRKKRTYPPEKAKVWEVAGRLGAAVRKAQSIETSPSTDGEHRSSKRPHIRKAHWHGFWTGKRNEVQKFILKWLPPLAVKAENNIVTTIHKVKDDNQ